MCIVSKNIGLNTENKICLQNKENMCSLMIKSQYGFKCIVYMHITAELKANWDAFYDIATGTSQTISFCILIITTFLSA